jgi:hypothetical protein
MSHRGQVRLPEGKLHLIFSSDTPGQQALMSVNQQEFFLRLGKRVRKLRRKHRHSQEDMISFGFSARHWQ